MAAESDRKALMIYMWLPAGKDIFGPVKNGEKATETMLMPVRGLYTPEISIRACLEKKIKKFKSSSPETDPKFRFRDTYEESSTDKEEARRPEDFVTESNRELGCRRLRVNIEYNYNGMPFEGQFQAYSNGLYLWFFEVRPECESGFIAQCFVADFIKDHIKPFFEGEWSKASAGNKPGEGQTSPDDKPGEGQTSPGNNPKAARKQLHASEYYDKYDGALSYHQFEILFDGIFNPEIDPHIFFRNVKDVADGKPVRQKDNKADEEKKYSMNGILDLTVLYHWDNLSRASTSEDIQYKIKKTGNPHILDSLILLNTEMRDEEADEKAIDQRAPAISWLALVAMEHFVRSTVACGIKKYRYGIDLIKYYTSIENMKTKIADLPKIVFAPSLKDLYVNSTNLSAYYSFILVNMSLVSYLKDLVLDLSITCTKIIPKEYMNDDILYDALKKRNKEFEAAWGQLERYIGIINDYMYKIENGQRNIRNEDMIYILNEINKNTEQTSVGSGRATADPVHVDPSGAFGMLAATLTAILGYIQLINAKGDNELTKLMGEYKLFPLYILIAIACIILFWAYIKRFLNFCLRNSGITYMASSWFVRVINWIKRKSPLCPGRRTFSVEMKFHDFDIDKKDYEALFAYLSKQLIAMAENEKNKIVKTSNYINSVVSQEAGKEITRYTFFGRAENDVPYCSVCFELRVYTSAAAQATTYLSSIKYTDQGFAKLKIGIESRIIFSYYIQKLYYGMDEKVLNNLLTKHGLPELENVS